jgi:hypothetical protein
MSSRDRSLISAVTVALATLLAFVLPIDFPTASFTPAHSRIARIVLLAMIPVPGEAGHSDASAPQKRPQTWCGMVACASAIRTIPFTAQLPPLWMASATSADLPCPSPTRPHPSPTATSALKVTRAPPFVDLAHLLITKTLTFNSCFTRSSVQN